MVQSVVRHYHWPITEVENLYLDDADFFGLHFWYNDVKEVIKSYKQENKK